MLARPFNNGSDGMSLIEAIMVVSVFTILSLVVMNSISSFYRYNAYTIAQSYEVSNARKGVDLLVRDLREMTYADDGTFPLVSMGSTSISFFSDIDRDDSVELVYYELIDTTVSKYVYDAVGTPPTYSTSTPDITYTISEYVQNIDQGQNVFRYYDENGLELSVATSSVTDVRYIDVFLIVNVDPVRDPDEFQLRSSASLRNLNLN